jgi:lysophospholipase L1-like esterase
MARPRRAGLLAATLTVLMGCQAPAIPAATAQPIADQPPAAEVVEVVRPQALDSFFADLRRLESGAISQVHIVQLGDSHTAGDVFTGRLRMLFQERFGHAGRGAMPPGKAYAGIRQKDVALGQSGAWTIHDSRTAAETGGITGFVAVAAKPGAAMQVSPKDGRPFRTARVDVLRRPGGGRLDILIDGMPVRTIATDGRRGAPAGETVTIPEGANTLGLVAKGRDVAVTGWAIETGMPGVLVESFGVVGATARLPERWNSEAAVRDMAALRPSLVILAYGTNEGFENKLDPGDYAQVFGRLIDRMRQWAPDASLLVIGPPQGQRGEGRCGDRRHPVACRWVTPANLEVVRDIQRRLATTRGAAFWDWSTVMALTGGIGHWVAAEPPLARPDHVHFTVPGYEMAADFLFERLMESYAFHQTTAGP